MHQGYLSFLLDLSAQGTNRVVKGSVRYEPTKSQKPANAFQWKVVLDVEDTVVVRGFDGTKYRVLGKAVHSNGTLTRHQGLPKVPNSYQWKLVEAAVREEATRDVSLLRSHPTWIEKVEVDDLADTNVEDVRIEDAPVEQRRKARASTPPAPRRVFVAAGAASVAVAIGAAVVMVKKEQPPRVVPPAAVATRSPPLDAAVVAPIIVDAPLPVEQQVASAPDFATAIALSRPAMDDSSDDLSPGAQLLARYASRQLRWADVEGAKETTIGHVLKDPDVERGKRLCAKGTVQSIERRDVDGRKVYVGRLSTDDADEIAFVAVGSTTDIVKRSKASICGAVIGRTGGAVSLVGMFDLPENRAPIVESER